MTSSVLLSLVVLVLLLGPVSSQNLDPALEDLIQRNTDFGTRLYRAVASRTDDNVFLSPLTLSAGLIALLTTTSGPTQDQLLQGLTLTGLDPQNLPDQFQTLRNTVFQKDAVQNLQQGVAIFPAQGFQVSTSYLDLVQTKFGGKVQSLNYMANFDAIDAINRWAQNQTGERVQELLSILDTQTQLLIATAASYQSKKVPHVLKEFFPACFSPVFNSSSTQDERFYMNKYQVVMVPMMSRADKYFLAYDRLVKAGVLKLPLADGAAMLVVLPDEGVDITAVEEEVTSGKIRTWEVGGAASSFLVGASLLSEKRPSDS
ncbi:protein Z-dependent protease inhibitor-like [Melanotaenia boesemani]|uniref:protein Z-dependent protease inhibitor-like n=1 Tax=Melanotaenia boesemani TaxID=1250792 RepID=UPI001C04DC4F|nr:protein Z-dependent protease inhibitor-like [Melanotaenia boesemani]